jgi:hypothetical protein
LKDLKDSVKREILFIIAGMMRIVREYEDVAEFEGIAFVDDIIRFIKDSKLSPDILEILAECSDEYICAAIKHMKQK